MSAPTSRTQRILAFVIANPGARSGQITAHLAQIEPPRPGLRLEQLVVAQLSQQLVAGKLRRTGKAMQYRYWPTPITLLDLRAFDRDGKPRKQPKPDPKPKRAAAKSKPAPKPAKAPRTAPLPTVLPKARRGAPHVPATGDVSTDVAAFLAAGGKVQRLHPHEASQGLRFDHSQTAVPARRRPAIRRQHAHAR